MALCIAIAVLCFMPCLLDMLRGTAPYTYHSATIVECPEMPKESEIAVIPLSGNVKVSQGFVCNMDHIVEIILQGCCEGVELTGNIVVSLYDDEKNEMLESWEAPVKKLGKDLKIVFSVGSPFKYGDLRNRSFRLDISTEGMKDGENVLLSYLPSDWYEKGKLTVDNAEVCGDLVMVVSGCSEPSDMRMSKWFMCFYIALFAEWTAYVMYRRFWKNAAVKEQVTNEKA